MKNFVILLGITVALLGCARKDSIDTPTGSDVTVQKTDGVAVVGRLIEVKPEQVVLEGRDGVRMNVPLSEIASIKATSAERPDVTSQTAAAVATTGTAPGMPARSDAPAAKGPDAPDAKNDEPQRPANRAVDRKVEYREVTVPAGTRLSVELTSSVASNTSHAEDAVRGRLRRPVTVGGVEALPAGSVVLGHVTSAHPPGKVKGRASVAFRFNQIDLPGEGGREAISTATYSRIARATKKKDAAKIGVGAGAGAIVGGILGGGSGAAKGAAIGGGAGTAVVLATKGEEVRIAAGAPVLVRLTAPLKVRVPVK
jgi:hypothetical protein